MRIFDRPQGRIVHYHLLFELAPAAGRNCQGRRRGCGAHHCAARHDGGRDAARLFRVALVIDFRDDIDAGLPRPHLAAHIRSPLRHVHRMGLDQPHVAVDARALIKPPFTLRRIHANHQDIRGSIINEVRHVIAERGVPAHVSPKEVTVKGHHRVAEDAVELDR